MEINIKNPQLLFNSLYASIVLFFFIGVLPALHFDDKIRLIVEQIQYSEDTESVLLQHQADQGLHIKRVDEKIVLEFKKPKYIFIYSDKDAESEFKKLLPRQFYVKIA